MTITDARPVALPRWTARLAFGSPSSFSDAERRTDPGVTRAGPLAIHDPAEDCEVFSWANGRRLVVFEGYLFDRDALAAEFRRASTSSSAMLVAAAYDRLGPGLFASVDGCYHAAVWDADADRLILGHDALGRHPVFYAQSRDAFWWTSNVLRLLSTGEVSTRPNRISLALLGLRYWPEAGETFLEDVRRLRPGHYLSISGRGTVVEQKYWDPLPDDDEPWLPEAQVLEEFEPALRRSVERCLQLAPQGIMLSGGVDSVTVAALAVESLRARGLPSIVAVSGRSGRALSPEEVMQSRVVAALGMRHVISTTPEWRAGRDPIELSLEVTPELASPSCVYWVGTYLGFYRRTAAEHLHVLLTGSGGDNWLSVGDAYAADLLRAMRLGQLFRFVRSDVTTGSASLARVAYRRLWAFGIRPHVDTLWARTFPAHKLSYHRRRWHERLPSWLAPDRLLREELVERLLGRRTPSLTTAGRAPRSQYRHALRSYSNPYMHHENETAFHIDALCGLRLLSPYHDRRLVSFFNRIAPNTLVHGTRYKGLLRPVVARHLPELGLERQRKDYPADHMARELESLRTSLARLLPDYGFRTLDRLGVVAPARLNTAFEKFWEKDVDGLARLYGLMSAERWLQAHGIG